MLSIGKLAPGRDPAAYYLDRVADKGCPTDYYTGSGEAPGRWIGRGIDQLGLAGPLDSDRSHGLLRDLLAGTGPDGQQLTAPVLRTDGRSRVLTAEVVEVVKRSAAAVDVDVEELLTRQRGTELVKAWHRAESELDRAQRRPTWPAPSMKATNAAKLLEACQLDPGGLLPQASYPRRFRDRLARALGNQDVRVDVRLPGLDLTLSAPKSVSVLYALADAQQREPAAAGTEGSATAQREPCRVAGAVQDAHRAAVQATIDYLELSCTDALRGHHRGDGTDTYVATDGFVGAAFEHRSSRCGDPQLHTHVVVANLLHGEDGKWSALNTREIYAHAKTAGYVYQAVLRGELTKTLGVTWDPVRNGQADMLGMPKPLLRLFSKRRVQIEAAMERGGLTGMKGAQIATLDTRERKPPAEGEVSLRERWQTEAADAGHNITRAMSATLTASDRVSVAQIASELARVHGPNVDHLADVLLEPDGLTHKRATFDRKDLLRGVCEHLPAGTPVSLNTLRALATRVIRDDRVVPLLGDAPVKARRYSTRELLTLEQDAVQLATDRLTDNTASLEPDRVESATVEAERLGLSQEQTVMLQRLLTSCAGVDVVVGAAGSGKTAALRVAADAWRAAGVEVRGTALAAIAARVLSDSAGIEAMSLQKLLSSLDQPGHPTTSASSLVLPTGGVLIVDEAGMVGTRKMHQLLTATAASGTKLVLVGDPHQLPEIEAGGLFATLAARLPSVSLERNQRQRARWEQRALRQLRVGDPVKALNAYQRKGRLRIEDDLGSLTDRLLVDYEQAVSTHTPEQALVIASSRSDARRLNAQLRARLLADGRLGNVELQVPLVSHVGSDGPPGQREGRVARYRVGEQVLVTVNDYPRGLLNGCRGTVTTLDLERTSLTARLDDGRTVQLDRDYLQTGQLTHGYALTAHKAQGTTVDVALLWGTQVLTRETGYVAMSRGRERNTLYATWDLLRHDLADAAADLDRPAEHRGGPDTAQRRDLARAALAERLGSSGRQRTARSWWRRPALPTTEVVERDGLELGGGRVVGD
jgi:hypothetical protein